MVAAQTMTTVFGEVTYPVMGAVKWHKTYYSMIATPLSVGEVILANLGFVMFRVATTSAVFLAVMSPFGVFESWCGRAGRLPRAAAHRAGLRHADLRVLGRAAGTRARSRWSSGSG